MCGRMVRSSPVPVLLREFGARRSEAGDLPPSWNVCPGQDVAALVVAGGERCLRAMRWGLPPASPRAGSPPETLINARAESAAERRSFRDALRRRRCLVLADGFYEWRSDGARTTPYLFRLRSPRPLAFAALWEPRARADSRVRDACVILTRPADDVVAPVHDRMPVILADGPRDAWLDAANDDPRALGALLTSFPTEPLVGYRVSTLVNSPRNDSPECARPAADDDRQASLPLFGKVRIP